MTIEEFIKECRCDITTHMNLSMVYIVRNDLNNLSRTELDCIALKKEIRKNVRLLDILIERMEREADGES